MRKRRSTTEPTALELRSLYLDHQDYADFAHAMTLKWQEETGTDTILWPLSYENVLIIGGNAIPVAGANRSAIYATSGEAIYVPKALSPRTRAA